jgi:hypothetical protein
MRAQNGAIVRSILFSTRDVPAWEVGRKLKIKHIGVHGVHFGIVMYVGVNE